MKVILLRFGELYLKGNNRDVFENTLIRNIKDMLKDEHYQFSKTFGRYVVSNFDENRQNEIIKKLKKVFGLYSLSPAEEVTAEPKVISEYVQKINCDNQSFKVFVKRADKDFPISSMEFAKQLGELVLNSCKGSSVD